MQLGRLILLHTLIAIYHRDTEVALPPSPMHPSLGSPTHLIGPLIVEKAMVTSTLPCSAVEDPTLSPGCETERMGVRSKLGEFHM